MMKPNQNCMRLATKQAKAPYDGKIILDVRKTSIMLLSIALTGPGINCNPIAIMETS
jgi:hypothetical protein